MSHGLIAVLTLPGRYTVSCVQYGGRRALHATGAASAGFGTKLFRGLFRRKRRAEVDPDAPPRLSLLNQTALPEDLRLPRPADPLNRVAAGVLDVALAGAGGAAVGAAAFYSGASGDLETAAIIGQTAALSLWVVRDGLGDGGNRSLGKRAFKVEVTLWDGTPAPPSLALSRNLYFLLLPLAGAHQYLGMAVETLLFWDVATLFLTPDARKAGDYALGTRVVDERPGRAERLEEAADAAEMRELRDRIEAASPGLLAARVKADPSLKSYEMAQAELAAAVAADATAVARLARAEKAAAAPATAAAGAAPPRSVFAAAEAAAAAPPTLPMGAGGMGGLFSEVRSAEVDAAAGAAAHPAGSIVSGGRVLHVNRPKKREV